MSDKVNKPIFDKRIFWDVNFAALDYDSKASFIIERVFERGDVEDIRQCRRYYKDDIISKTLTNARWLSLATICLASALFNNQLTDYKCYNTAQLNPGHWEILKGLMDIPELKDFSLVGRTALALYFGHRLSIDLDLFSTTEFNNETIISPLESKFPGFSYRNSNNPIGLFGFINETKVDFVKHHYHPLIEKIVVEDGIRLFSIPDIMAMKIAAIMKRGVKKDFWDIAELLNHYTVEDFIRFYTVKYPSQQLLISVPYALTYFIDAEESEEPVSLKGQTWSAVKKFIQQKVSDFLR